MIKYIKSKSAYILVCAAALAVFFSVIALYRLNIYAVLYAALLSSLLIIPFAAVRIIKSVNAQKQLLKILKSEEIMIESNSFPETRDSEKQYYTEIIKRLAAEKQTLISDLAIKLRETDDYYTLWAHQIKTPIAAMHLLLQSDSGTLSRECESELFKIEQYTEMALGYIRLESGTNDFVITACDTDRIIKSVLKKFSKQFILKKLTLDYKETGLTAVTDEKQLGFIIEQIISNSLKYTKKGTISVYSKGNSIFISDTGIGISGEDLPRIFEKGYTGYNGRTDRKSTGLGLYLCRRTADKLGHTLRVSSEVGKGTLAEIDLTPESIEIE